MDITNYPNPLAVEFSSRFQNPTMANVLAFVTEKLQDETNLQRLNADGSVSRASVKVLYEGQTQGLQNSVLAKNGRRLNTLNYF